MDKRFTEDFKKGFWTAFYEYVLITLPVTIYVILEALHKKDWIVLFITPEWSIATIFLSFTSITRYRNALEKSGKPIFEPIFGLISIVSLLLIVGATINTYVSMNEESNAAIILRLSLFFIVTIKFFILVTGSKLLKSNRTS